MTARNFTPFFAFSLLVVAGCVPEDTDDSATPAPAPAPICQPWDCGGFPDGDNATCADGQTVSGPTGACVGHGDGTCAWEVISCPVAEECTPAECGPSPGMPTYLCPDGTHIAGPTGLCYAGAQGCQWEVAECPGTQAFCPEAECGPTTSLPSYVCPDGVTLGGPTGNCVETPTGDCGWEVVSCYGGSTFQ